MASSLPAEPLDTPPAPLNGAAGQSEDPWGRGARPSPWFFAPCFGTWQGLINPVLVTVPTVLLKSLGFSNAVIGYASLATLPMALKFIFGPTIDAHRTRRWWCVNGGAWLMACLLILALPLLLPTFSIWLYLGALALLAIVKSIHQIALNGFFTLALTKSEQALFSGLDPVWGRAATIFSGSLLLAAAGIVGERYGDARVTWTVYFAGLIAVFAPLYFYTRWAFPTPAADRGPEPGTQAVVMPFREVLRGYFALPALLPGLAYLFFMRFGETLLAKMGVAFLMDAKSAGGYALNISEVGVFTGAMTGCAIAGGAISGVLLKRLGLRRVIWSFTLAAVLPHLAYVYLALTNDVARRVITLNLEFIGAGVWRIDPVLLALLGVENLGFGLGFTIMNYYMFRMAAGSRYPASFVALNASVIYASYLISSTISGVCQEWLGYTGLFVLSLVLPLPAFFAIPFLNYQLDQRSD
jgi:PAT family beta-lactamase induction signal transducer AmpG